MRRGTRRTWWGAGLLALLLALTIPSVASAIGISLNRAPAPPQAIQRGVGTEQMDFSITYQTVAHSYQVLIQDPAGNIVQSTTNPAAGQPSPINSTAAYAPPLGAPEGRYRATVNFFSGSGSLESSALVTFDVAAQLGTLQVVKYEDLNGDGVRQAGEPGVPGWVFNLTNPQGNDSVVQTGPDGTVTIPNVPAGTWQVAEVVDQGWVPTSPPNGVGTVVVPPNGVGTFLAGNVRPAPISGTVYMDANRNGRLDPGEVGRGGVKLTLTGTRPVAGAIAPKDVISNADGTYLFPDNMPGTYAVEISTPGGLTLTSAKVISNIQITSGVGSPNNNFGLAQPGGTTAGGPTPNIGITKTGPSTARPSTVFDYSIVVRNRSNFTARNVEVTDLLPDTLTLVSIPSGATIRNGVITWDVGDLAGGASKTLTIRVRVNPNTRGTVRNTATVTADNLPPRRSTETTQVLGPTPVARTGGVTG
ncbi:MAG: SdrD B-like domain-containing protein [Thermoleophilia bacterium]